MGTSGDDVIITPISTATRTTGSTTISTVYLKAKSEDVSGLCIKYRGR